MKYLILFSILFFYSCSREEKRSDLIDKVQFDAKALEIDSNNLSKAKAILKTVHGNIIIQFYPRSAPITVTRIITLIRDGYYNGLTFHRVFKNFIVQTGDPTATGKGGSGLKLKAEFNNIPHIEGTVAMARLPSDENSADSQFYISIATSEHLDHKYTVFGQVTSGIEIVKKIQQGDKIISLTLIE